MDTLGEHYLIEMFECNPEALKYIDDVRGALMESAKKSRATIVSEHFHNFSPYGVSGVVIIAESHLSIHTWPEYKYAAIDYYSCDANTDPMIAVEYLKEHFGARDVKILQVKRGELTKDKCNIVPHIPYYTIIDT